MNVFINLENKCVLISGSKIVYDSNGKERVKWNFQQLLLNWTTFDLFVKTLDNQLVVSFECPLLI